jgi:hypothetical protein
MRFALFALIVACGGTTKDADPFATFQACYDEHHSTESFPAQMAIEICCLDHPIGGAKVNVVCGATADSCTAYVTQNLTDTSDTMLAADISAACADYVVQRGK